MPHRGHTSHRGGRKSTGKPSRMALPSGLHCRLPASFPFGSGARKGSAVMLHIPSDWVVAASLLLLLCLYARWLTLREAKKIGQGRSKAHRRHSVSSLGRAVVFRRDSEKEIQTGR